MGGRSDRFLVMAINPLTMGIEKGVLIKNWFGEGKHAIRFLGYNNPNYRESDIPWEKFRKESG